MVKPYKRIDTTADVGLYVSGDSLNELFKNTAKGLFSLIAPLPSIRKGMCFEVQAKAPSLDELLVAWLNELIFVHETKMLIFRDFEILSLDNKHLNALCLGESIDPKRHSLKMEVKAATYHRLSIWRDKAGQWRARVILDV